MSDIAATFVIDNPVRASVYAAGVDLADGVRLRRAVERSGPGFVRRIFDADERTACAYGDDLAATARLFGIKESVIKLIGGLPPGGRYADIHVTTPPDPGEPALDEPGFGEPAPVGVTLGGALAGWDTAPGWIGAPGVELTAGGAALSEHLVLTWAVARREERAC